MSLDNNMKERIETAMAGIDRSALLRIDRSFNEFVREFGLLIAQANRDREPLAATGMDFDEMPYYEALFEMLTMEHAARVNAAAVSLSEERTEYAEALAEAKQYNAALSAAGRFVVTKSGKPEAKRVYNRVRKGTGEVDLLNDNLSMVRFVRQFSDVAAGVRPGGEALTEERLARIEAESIRLLKLYGAAKISSDAGSTAVERQQRLLTLCIGARNEIKLYAEMAFYNDMERYNRDYVIQARRTARAEEPETETALVVGQ